MGFKLQVTETAEGSDRFITDVAIVTAMTQDNQCLDAIQERLVERGVPPGRQYVDQAYMSGEKILTSLERGIDLRGYIREGNISKPGGFRLRDLTIDIENRQAICPAGNKPAKWTTLQGDAENLVAYHVSFGSQCRACPFFGLGLCTDRPGGRHLGISRHHDLIQARRHESSRSSFRAEM